MKLKILIPALAAALLLAACGGGASSSGLTDEVEANAPAEAAQTNQAGGEAPPSETESAATGDIPDNQAFLVFHDPSAGYSIRYPEGWARKGSGNDVSFREKANVIHITVHPGSARAKPGEKMTVKKVSSADPVTGKRLPLTVDRERAAFSAWYELFPRSTSPEPGRHGTFRDVEARLPYIAELGFDVLYLTPIHPIGHTFRKGKDNSPAAQPGEPGSPYAVGNEHGGHKSIHPELGTLDDFRSLVRAARELGIEIALDNAFQCSPDHPYVREHPDWFYVRPDGSIQYAENPPKKYQDVYPFNFESDDWRALWDELKSFFSFWAEQGVRIFRVDNPHTKAFGFWEWCIGELKREYPDLIFLSEAFTRPKVMYRLAKLGFSQSYTYFAWRTTKAELTEYMTELTQTPVREFFRPNFWPTTHDILTPQYYDGYRATFIARLALAATLTANYGIYGPAYELMLHTPVGAREEYIDNEKYELRVWDLDDPRSLRPLIARLNRIRRENPALQRDTSIRFHAVENNYVPNDQLIAYTKQSPDGRNVVLVVVNLDPVHVQSGWLRLPLADLGIGEGDRFYVHDMLSETRYAWAGEWNFVQLDPAQMPVHVFRLERPRDERSFDYYL